MAACLYNSGMSDSPHVPQTSQPQSPAADELTLDQLISDYRDISMLLDANWPLENKNERVFARTMKLMEEMGEMSNEILTKMGFQRQSKIDAFKEHHLEDELADVIGSILLLAIELDIDIKPIMQKKIAFTMDRLQAELEKGDGE